MSTARRMALTATLATTAALSIAGVTWGIGSTVGGESTAPSPVAATADPERPSSATDSENGTMAGRGPGLGNDHADLPPAVPGATVADEVAAQLTYLIEEEKLAGDVYALGESLYGARVFSTISRAEDTHADEVRVLLDRYDVSDPTVGAAAGTFTDPDLQALYDELADQVRASWSDAVAAGILVEQTDIADLQVLLDSGALPTDVRAVAQNLLAGSQRHLAAFQRQAA